MSDKTDIPHRIWRACLRKYYAFEKSILENPTRLHLFIRIIMLLPIQKNKVIFDNNYGNAYGGNPKYIAEELIRRHAKVKLVWLRNNESYVTPEGITPVSRDSLKAYYESATAKAWVFNTRVARLTPKRKRQVYLQTWHGAMICLKKIEKDAESSLGRRYIASAQEDGACTDGILANSQWRKEQYQRAFWLSKETEILCFGTPRSDCLIKGDQEKIKNKVKTQFGIKKDTTIVLYAPTFRNSGSEGGYIKDFEGLKDELNNKFGDVAIFVRLHPVAALHQKRENHVRSNTYTDVTNYPDVQELLIASDYLISDYSSIAYDFILLRRPVFLYVSDLQDYLNDRGVYDIFYEQPFDKAGSEKELLEIIKSFNQDAYNKRVSHFIDLIKPFDKGDAAQLSVNWLVSKGLACKTVRSINGN